MNRRVLFPVLLIVISTWAAGQSYGPPGISTTLPTTTAIAPPLTPSAAGASEHGPPLAEYLVDQR